MEQKKFYMHRIDNLLIIKKICTIHYQSLPKGYVSKEEAHDFWELIYADKEGFTLAERGKRTEVSHGEAFFIEPNAPHFIESGGREPNIFIITFECRSECMDFFRNRTVSVPKKRRDLLQTMMTEALGTFELPDFDPNLNRLNLKKDPLLGGEQILKNSLETLLIYLLRRESDRTPEALFVSKASDDDLESQIEEVLRGSVYGKFSLDALSERLHYGKVKLCNFFRERTGTGIYRTYLRLKTDEAKKLIRKGTPFSEIAELLCYDSIASFHSAFRRETGMTPGEYRASIR